MTTVLETERLVLREVTLDDAPFMLELLNSRGFIEGIADRGVRTVEQAEAYIEERVLSQYRDFGFGMWTVTPKGETAPVGLAGLVKREVLPHPDVGYAFLEPAWGRGYATEAAAGVLDYARDRLGLRTVLAITSLGNQASQQVLRKVGMKFVENRDLPGWAEPSACFATMTTLTVKANGFSFAVDEEGEGDHLALCLHGFPESRFSWRHQLPLLARMGYRAWAPDLRGYGATEPKPRAVSAYLIDELMRDVTALIEASGAKHVTLIAHDWGGALAWTYLAKAERPKCVTLERLVAMNIPHPAVMNLNLQFNPVQLWRSAYVFFFQLPWLPEWVMTHRDAQVIRDTFYDWAIDKTHFTPQVLDRYAQDAQRPGAIRGMINWYRAAVQLGGQLRGKWPMIDTPTLIIWGEEDKALGRELLKGTKDFVRNLTIQVLPGVSHWVQQEAPDKVNAILEAWLPNLRPAGSRPPATAQAELPPAPKGRSKAARRSPTP